MMMRPAINAGNRRIQMPMAREIPLDIVGGTHFGRYHKISSEETFNMIVSDGALVPFAGYKKVAQIVKNGEAREIYTSVRYQHMIAVIDDGVFTISSDLAIAKVASLNTSAGNVFIAENDAGQIAIADGLNIYIYDYIHDSFTVPTIDFLPVYVAFQDTYFIAADGRTNQWRLSDNNNGNSWPADAQHVGSLQTKPTNTVACVPLDRQLFIFGQTVAEPWYDVGATLFPYQRSNFYNVDFGCISPETIATGFSKLVWLASNEKSGYAIMYSQGGVPQKISNDGLDFLFARLTNPQDSFGYLFRLDGHEYYVLTFRTDNLTYAYDFNTQMFFTLTDENLNHHIAKRVTFFNNKNYFVSFVDGNLYEMSSDFNTYDGKTIPRSRIITPKRLPNSDRFIVPNISLTLEEGVENAVQKALLSLSRDSGESWGNVMATKLNPYGKRESYLQFWQLGMGNDMTYKFTFWGNSRFVIIGGTMSIYQ